MLAKQSKELSARLAQIEKQAFEVAGESFNLGSPKQIQHIFFDKLGLPVLRKTPTGQPSTAEDVLQEMADDHELPRLILEHRGMSKLKSTYTDKLPQQINPQTGRVHTSYNQTGAATGRLSSTDPNLQNIPIKTEEGRRIRQALLPKRATNSCQRIIRKSNCASWRTCPVMPACLKPLPKARTFIAPPRPKCLA